ncbi:MAG: SDR family oxidoreductase, partial [Dehalococcoidales bacterium]|nr:SDR family oxidoreductase [Dehalococcoidales bacterium]
MSIPSFSVQGKTAIVTGARRGIGMETAMLLAEAGADVAVCDLVADNGELEKVVKDIKKLGRRALMGKVDVKNKTDVDEFVKRVIAEFGGVDILVNNAGAGSGTGPAEKEKFEAMRGLMQDRWKVFQEKARITFWQESDWDAVMAINLKGILLFSQAVAESMIKKGGGAIVNVSSVMAFGHGASLFSAYSVSKRGIVTLTEGLAGDLGKFGIRVNAIAPGGIETEMM